MREILFREWDTPDIGETHSMKYSKDYGSLCGFFTMVNGDILMQFTGLLDKKGVEIYEGDIVLILYTDWPSQSAEKNGRYAMSLDEYKDSISNIGKVVFKDDRFCIQFNDDGYTQPMYCGPHGQINVIGNIHMNPDLLEVSE